MSPIVGAQPGRRIRAGTDDSRMIRSYRSLSATQRVAERPERETERRLGIEEVKRGIIAGGGTNVRVMLVDDATLVREGIARLLTDEGVEVVAQRADATDLLEAVRADPPDTVVIDVRMPPTHTTEGLQAAVELKRELPDLGVLVLSQHVETRHAVDLLTSGHKGVGYMLKERITRPAELVDAVRRVAGGGTAIDPVVVRTVFDTPRHADPMADLTTRERDVLELVAEGHSNDWIAQRLALTTRTVESHTSRIFAKLGLEADPATHRRVLAVLAHLRASASPPR